MNRYYDTRISTAVRHTASNKLHRISVRGSEEQQVPYITYKRKTRVLYRHDMGGAYINVGAKRVYFQ